MTIDFSKTRGWVIYHGHINKTYSYTELQLQQKATKKLLMWTDSENNPNEYLGRLTSVNLNNGKSISFLNFD